MSHKSMLPPRPFMKSNSPIRACWSDPYSFVCKSRGRMDSVHSWFWFNWECELIVTNSVKLTCMCIVEKRRKNLVYFHKLFYGRSYSWIVVLKPPRAFSMMVIHLWQLLANPNLSNMALTANKPWHLGMPKTLTATWCDCDEDSSACSRRWGRGTSSLVTRRSANAESEPLREWHWIGEKGHRK